jgi:5-dehydro-2-deoxygluconokinase
MMLNIDRVYMLAADHRWQWEEWCDKRSIGRDRIGAAKRVAYEGFLMARRTSPAARQFGAMLLDEQYSSAIIAEGIREGLEIGTPAEKAGAFPLAWAADPFDRALTGTFVKVLLRHRPDDDRVVRDEQLAKLDLLHAWCERHNKPLIVEILVPRDQEPEAEFEATGRPAIVAAVIRDAYARGLAPAFWKIEGTPSVIGARTIDAAVAERPDGRQIILGKAADVAAIQEWFTAAAACATAVGFAIGRSVFWQPCTDFLGGLLTAAAAARGVADRYLQLISTWDDVRSSRTFSRG